MKSKSGLIVVFFTIILLIIVGTSIISKVNTLYAIESETIKWEDEVDKYKLENQKIEDNSKIYEMFNDDEVENLYVTVLPPKEEKAVTFNELNNNVNLTNDVYNNDTDDPVSEIYFSTGPDMVSENEQATGTIEIRGQSSRTSQQKSYKIKLNNNSDGWHGFKVLNLNKHFYDELRIKNKLSFDLFKNINNITSYRTKFIKLHIRDLSQEGNGEYESYGLYTFIEQPNKTYLKEHNLDPNGYFYKAEYFEFFRYEDIIKQQSDPTYDEAMFESILETRGNSSNKKLIEMLDAVNDYSRDINEVVDKYFDEDNMLTWVASNILMNNYDTSSRNFLIYNGLNSDQWFFVPWDYDATWSSDAKPEESWEFGIANYWGMSLFNRYFKYEENVQSLNEKIEELYEIINEENVLSLVNKYYDMVEIELYLPPDNQFMKVTQDKYREEIELLAKVPEVNRDRYYRDLERPLPFFLWEGKVENEEIVFTWDKSYDMQDDEITYEFILAKDIGFNEIVTTVEGLKEEICTIAKVPEGQYYWRVIARDSQGNWRYPFDYEDINWGFKRIEIK